MLVLPSPLIIPPLAEIVAGVELPGRPSLTLVGLLRPSVLELGAVAEPLVDRERGAIAVSPVPANIRLVTVKSEKLMPEKLKLTLSILKCTLRVRITLGASLLITVIIILLSTAAIAIPDLLRQSFVLVAPTRLLRLELKGPSLLVRVLARLVLLTRPLKPLLRADVGLRVLRLPESL